LRSKIKIKIKVSNNKMASNPTLINGFEDVLTFITQQQNRIAKLEAIIELNQKDITELEEAKRTMKSNWQRDLDESYKENERLEKENEYLHMKCEHMELQIIHDEENEVPENHPVFDN
tara:strand:- start:137 stop:490 length:354 start_codon:yes stop_codon:yes gene_type:complete